MPRLIRVALLALVVVMTSLTAQATASASPPAPVSSARALAPGCDGDGCTGLDPEVQGCSADARTVDHFNAHYYSNLGLEVYVELRHSSACRARWLRVTSGRQNGGCGGGAPPQVRLRNLTSAGTVLAERLRTFSPCDDFPIWTRMVGRTPSSARVQFCFQEKGTGFGTDSYYAPCASQAWP